MHVSVSLFALLLQTISTVRSQQLQWPYNLPPHEKYYPEHEELVKRNNEILQRLQEQPADGVRKMSPDPGEKFYLDYWTFASLDVEYPETSSNRSISTDLHAPIALHSSDTSTRTSFVSRRYIGVPIPGRNLFAKRDFTCPTGTQSCSSIGQPDSCCPTSSTCQIVTDTGLGNVGCCDASTTCAGSVSTCPSGYSSCPNNPGGGCCLPGYACYEQGCVLTSTTIVAVQPSSTSILTSLISSSIVTVTTVVVVTTALPITSTIGSIATTTTFVTLTSGLTVVVTSTSVTTQSPTSTSTLTPTSTLIITSTSTSTSELVCSMGYKSCPASLGGGCCPTDRACASDSCAAVSTSASLAAPVRPTTVTTSSTSTSTTLIVGCPTGFYACSAYYQGGCCQNGRDCASTTCPISATTVVKTNGVTAVAPEGTYLSSSTTLLTGTCATGWFSCASTDGGGCCPSGYACGTVACSATASGGQGNQVGKIAPNSSSTILTSSTMMLMMFGVSMASLVVMIAL